jgi:hypothetical protein
MIKYWFLNQKSLETTDVSICQTQPEFHDLLIVKWNTKINDIGTQPMQNEINILV